LLRESIYQTSVLDSADAIDPSEWEVCEFSFDPSEWGPEFIFDTVEWGFKPSNKLIEKWQIDIIKEILKTEFEGTPLKWIFLYRFPKGYGDLDGLGYRDLPDGMMEVVVSVEMNNFGSRSWVADSRTLKRWSRLESLAKKGIIKLHSNYKRFHLLCGGHRFQYCLHPQENDYRLFRFPSMIGPIPRRTQLRFLKRVAKEIKKAAISVLYPRRISNVCYNVDILDMMGGRYGITTDAATADPDSSYFWRFSGG
jgi:hypothetical protein